MKIAILTTSYPSHADDPSGHFVASDARARARDGNEVIVIAPRVGDLRGDDARDGIRVVRLDVGDAFGWPGIVARVREKPMRIGSFLRWIVKARRALVAEGHVDRVVAHWAVPNGWPIAHRGSTYDALEVISHGADVRALLALAAPMRNGLVASIAARADVWRFVSEPLRASLARGLSEKTSSALNRVATVAPSPIEIPDTSDRAESKRRALGERTLLVTVARLVRSKRIEAVIDHVASHRPTHRTHMHSTPLLVIVGDGPERARLEAHARARHVDARFVGQTGRTDALAWIQAADAFLFASRTEGLSTVLREAEALGTRIERID